MRDWQSNARLAELLSAMEACVLATIVRSTLFWAIIMRLTSSVRIRTAGMLDKESVFLLAGELASSFVVQREAFNLSYEKLLRSSDALLAVAIASELVIGYVLAFDHLTFFANGRVVWVEEIIVSSELRRQGVGGKLMEAVEQWARERGARLVALATRRAAPFYGSLKYEESAAYFRKLL